MPQLKYVNLDFFFFFKKYVCFYLAAPVLRCGAQVSLIVGHGLGACGARA